MRPHLDGDYLCALHESGHCIAAELLNIPYAHCSIEPRADDVRGHLRVVSLDSVSLEDRAVLALCGPWGERLADPSPEEWRAHGAQDFAVAESCAALATGVLLDPADERVKAWLLERQHDARRLLLTEHTWLLALAEFLLSKGLAFPENVRACRHRPRPVTRR